MAFVCPWLGMLWTAAHGHSMPSIAMQLSNHVMPTIDA